MRNLLLLAVRYHAFIIFVVLQTFSLVLVFKYNSFQRASILDSTQQMVGSVNEVSNNITSFFQLGKVNKELSARNARLSDSLRLIMLQVKDSEPSNVIASPVVNNYEFISAQIVSQTYTRRNNYFTINKGAEDFITKHCGVVTDKGVVGILKNTSQNYASGLSLLHTKTSISAKISELNEVGALEWVVGDRLEAELKYVPRHVKVKVGQDVVVSHLSFTFPENTPIGKVSRVETPDGSPYCEIYVTLHQDIKNVKHVYVVKHVRGEEKAQLEEETMQE